MSAGPSHRTKGPLAVYVHTPFCPTKCGYCDFNSFALTGAIQERTVRAIAKEIEQGPLSDIPSKTIFFGGGTPTYLAEGRLEGLLDAIRSAHPPAEGCEITSEANPGTADAKKFESMHRAGFNRISIGAQSFLDSDLERLGRVHKSDEIGRAVSIARKAGFENLNLDLMFALPGQSPNAWKENLERAIELQPEHLSLYCLTLEPNTPFYKEKLAGALVQPDEEAQVDMYELAVSQAEAAGYLQYEISNFAKPGFECRHNLAYWRGEDYAGYGPGAVGCFHDSDNGRRVRYTNLKHPSRYCLAVESGSELWCEWEEVDSDKERIERIMLGLRLNEGLPRSLVQANRANLELKSLTDKGWVEAKGGRLRLTPQGRHWCSEVALELIG
jgi:oxygen-independent coproporphyrinogen-3 oxidase